MIGDASLMRAGAVAISHWRKSNSDSQIEVLSERFAGLNLSGCNLEGASLRSCTFIDCDLRRVNFANTNLELSSFVNCNLSHSLFTGAQLRGVSFEAVDFTGANLKGAHSLGRLKRLLMKPLTGDPPTYDSENAPWIDRWLGWDRLRFLSTIRIFLPAYTSLAISVLAINVITWVNAGTERINFELSRLSDVPIALIPTVNVGWPHIALVVNFLFLAISATAFLGCPPRVTEFTRERWVFDLKKPELLYDFAAWQRFRLRVLCALTLTLGGLMSAFLLGRAIVQQILFIASHIS